MSENSIMEELNDINDPGYVISIDTIFSGWKWRINSFSHKYVSFCKLKIYYTVVEEPTDFKVH